jgi:prefoldin subunit 5
MAFDFLGIFSKQEFESLRTFLQGEVDKVDAQINYMVLESSKLQKTLNELISQSQRSNVKMKMFNNTFYRSLQSQVDDVDSATIVQLIKEPYYKNIKVKDYHEHKVRKMMDELEQIQERIHLLRISKSEYRTNIEKVNSLFDAQHKFLTVEKEVG